MGAVKLRGIFLDIPGIFFLSSIFPSAQPINSNLFSVRFAFFTLIKYNKNKQYQNLTIYVREEI